MWYKVTELKTRGFNKSQISRELGLDRSTVRKYLEKDETGFHQWIETVRNLPKKLQGYYHFVKEQLEAYPYLSSAQIEDRLKERFSDLPVVHSKTVYNFVDSIRKRHQIKKNKEKKLRQYEKQAEPDYGHQAQADFGEYCMQSEGSGRKKVYFFVMVLCRSRQKYVSFQTHPFTTQSTIGAHERAFEYFGGQPREVIYDQDRVLIVDENLGDILLTQAFSGYCAGMDFKTIFCRKSDPESKGKVENVVGYVKKNFLRGRVYQGEESLNASVLGWLTRTGNGKEHAGTKKVPHEQWLMEREYLLPLPVAPKTTKRDEYKAYTVRKDNTINYRSNFYSLPLGTYQGADSKVLLEEKEGEINLFDTGRQLLTTHKLSPGRGATIRNSDHGREKSQSLEVLKAEVESLMQHTEKAKMFIGLLVKEKKRYLRDNLLMLKKGLSGTEPEFVQQAVEYCLENNAYNANTLAQAAKHYQKQQIGEKKVVVPWDGHRAPEPSVSKQLEPQKSKIGTYEKVM